MHDYKPSAADYDLFDQVAGLVRNRRSDFIEAGQWLDSKYTNEAIRDRHEAERQCIIDRNRKIAEDVKRGRGELPVITSELVELEPMSREPLIKLKRFKFAWYKAFSESRRLRDLPLKKCLLWARRRILLAWLITAPDAGDVARLTDFQCWPWTPTEGGYPDFDATDPDEAMNRYFARNSILGLEQNRLPALAGIRSALDVLGTAEQQLAELEMELPQRVQIARDQWLEACEALGTDNPTDREAYDLLERTYKQEKKPSPLVTFGAWTGYLRQWRRATGQQKRKPRAGRTSSGSVVKAADL